MEYHEDWSTGRSYIHPNILQEYRNKDKWHNPYRSADGFCELYLTLTDLVTAQSKLQMSKSPLPTV